MSEPTIAVLDACVLYSATLRDLFMWLTIRLAFYDDMLPLDRRVLKCRQVEKNKKRHI